MLSMTMPGACDGAWHDDKRFDDPNDAVTHRLRLARRYLSVKNAAVDELTFGAELKHGSKSAPQRLAAIQRILEAASNRASKSLKHGALLVHEVTERDLKRIFVLTISTNGTRKTKARR